MNDLELITKIYKPYRITKVQKCTIIETSEGKFALKPKSKCDIKDLYSYLRSRNFTNFPEIIDDARSELNIFEYVEPLNYPEDQKAIDMIKLVANLHRSTSYSKEVREDKFKEIYDNISGNLLYYKNKYDELVTMIENEVFMSPSHYLFIRNSSKLFNQISFCEKKLGEWYESVKDKREIRVSRIHNNLELNHYIKNGKEVLISWDASTTDTPILDIYNLYQKEALNLEFKSILKTYLRSFDLNKDELDLLLIMLCMPHDITFREDEFTSCRLIRESLDYVFKTEELVRPYYAVNDEE